MRKSLLTTLFVFLAVAISANGVFANDWHVGVKAGVNLASASGDDVNDDASSILGIAGGVFFIFPLSDNIGIQPELLYSQKGSELETEIFGQTVTNTTTLNYLDIPIFLRYQGGSGDLTFFGLLGPNIGLWLSGTNKAESDAGEQEADIEDGIASLDLGLGIGAGVAMAVGGGFITFDLRYVLGLTSIDDTDGDFDVKNNVIGIMVGYAFK